MMVLEFLFIGTYSPFSKYFVICKKKILNDPQNSVPVHLYLFKNLYKAISTLTEERK